MLLYRMTFDIMWHKHIVLITHESIRNSNSFGVSSFAHMVCLEHMLEPFYEASIISDILV